MPSSPLVHSRQKKIEDSFIIESKFEELFQHNITLLNECGIFFPFYYDHFTRINHEASKDMQMMDIQVANQYLV